MQKLATESGTGVLVFNEKGEVLVLTASEWKARPDRSLKPDLPGGAVDPGETERDGVKRELFEEAGISVDLGQFTLAYTKTIFFEPKNTSVSRFLYFAFLDYTPEVTLSWEHCAYEWVSPRVLIEKFENRPFYKEAIDYCFTVGLITSA